MDGRTPGSSLYPRTFRSGIKKSLMFLNLNDSSMHDGESTFRRDILAQSCWRNVINLY